MPLASGTRLGPYEVSTQIGAGGMGEVYRASDTKLGRDVALKILPEAFASDPDRLARFRREAQVLASLNHPGIAQIHGLEDSDGVHALVMELVEGPTLADLIAQGPIPASDALPIAKQIAEALEAAHEQGIIHRDLKPQNIKVRPDGTVKVLDFGLAKAMEPTGAAAPANVSQVPTITTPAMTQAGMILGTAAYMSPEQARGKTVDKRADIWAFGAVLFEMLTGTRAFGGDDIAETIGAVIHKEPVWSRLPTATPAAVRAVLLRCLQKDPRQRLRDIGDARLELHDTAPADAAGSAAARPSRTIALGGWIAAAVLLVAVIALLATRGRDLTPATAAAAALHAEIGLPDDAPLGFGLAALGVDSNLLALSPDGTILVYVGAPPGAAPRLYRKDLTSFDPPAVIAGTEGAYHAFFSPDGGSIGFVTGDKLKRVAPNGDDLRTIAPINTVIRGQWVEGDTIYVGAEQGRRLQRVPAGGGQPEDLYENSDILFLEVLDHGRSALLMRRKGISADYFDIGLLDLETYEIQTILEGGYDARLLGPDRLVFARGGSLLEVPFDAEEGRTTGEPATILREVVMDTVIGQAQFAVSDSGTMVFARGPETSRGGVARIDRDGNQEFLPVELRAYGVLDLDPTGRKLAIQVADIESYVWVYDIPSGRGTRLPGRRTGWPVWSNHGGRIGYSDASDGTLRFESVDGIAASRPAIPDEWRAIISSWSPDDRVLAIHGGDQNQRIGFLNLEDGTVAWVDNGGSYQAGAAFSPDGKWVAYSSNETGGWEVWVRSYPDGSVVRQISDGGGLETVWSPSGELFYRRGGRWMSVAITTEPTLSWSAPRQVFETDFVDTAGRSYDVSSDGQSLYVIKQPDPPDGTRVHVVTGWAPGS